MRKHRILLAVACMTPMTLLGVTPVASCESAALCSCIYKEPLKERVLINMQAAEGVLLATVEDTIAAEGERPPMAVLRVSRWWKGGNTDTLRVGQRASNTMMSSCHRRLNVNETYILFLPRRPGLWFYSMWCTGTMLRSEARADSILEYLGPGYEPIR